MNEVAILALALQKTDPAERDAFLDEACGEDVALRARVDDLLKGYAQTAGPDEPALADRGTGPFVSAQTGGPAPVLLPQQGPGTQIGPYQLLSKLGEGGMGEVWLAQQSEPVKRQVALKLIKAGMDSRAVLSRFEAERQALALMDHPNIARVFDGGLTDDRRPFFVMELVNGQPLTKFCDDARLTPRQRLELFVPICQAVQHAHQKGVVHRDLKPSNILITLYDGKPVPKVIDFGVAKAVAGKLTDESLATHFGAVVGTLEYMAPEQAGPSAFDVDTRADIYSLGVILYELLTGLRPLDARRLKKAALTEMIRVILEEEPSKPSTRLSTDEGLPSLAALRQTEPKRLTAMLRGELDWVVMKCLEKDRNRRYETANGLARDIQHYLADEPVEARPASFGYRAGKFLRRNKRPVLAAAVVLLALVGGIVGTSVGLVQANEARENETIQRGLADEQATEAKQQAANALREKGIAQARLGQVEKANDILGSIFRDLDPRLQEKGGPALQEQLRDRLEEAARALEGQAVGDPLMVARLQQRLGWTLLMLGRHERAIELLEKARHTFEAALGPDDPDTLHLASMLATAYETAGRLREALPLLEATLAREKIATGPDHPNTLITMHNLAGVYWSAGRVQQALPLYEETLEKLEEQLGPTHLDVMTNLGNLGIAYRAAGRLDRALPLLEEALARRQATLGDDHPDTLLSLASLALAREDSGRLDQAPLLEEVVARGKTKLGEGHPATLQALSNLAAAYQKTGRLREALPLYEQALAGQKARLGADHPNTLDTMQNLSVAWRESGRLREGLTLAEQVHALRRAKLGPDHPDTLFSELCLAAAYYHGGRPDRAIPLLEEVLLRLQEVLGPDHPFTRAGKTVLALSYQALGRLDRAVPLLEQVLEKQKAGQGADHPDTLRSMAYLGSAYVAAGRLAEGLPLLEQALAGQKTKLGPDHPDTLRCMTRLASGYQTARRQNQAVPLFEEALARQRALLGPDHPTTVGTMNNLAVIYWSAGRLDRSVPLFEEALRLGKPKLGDDHPDMLSAMGNLGVNYHATGHSEKAVPLLEEAVQLARGRLGPDHVETLNLAAGLGINYRDSGQVEKAIPLLEDTLRRAGTLPGGIPPRLSYAPSALADAYDLAGQYAKSEGFYRSSLEQARKQFGKDDERTITAEGSLGINLLQQQKYADAEPSLRALLRLGEENHADRWTTFQTRTRVGACLLGQKKFAEAEPFLVQGYEGMKERAAKIPPQYKGQRLQEALEKLVQLYEAWGKADEAAKWTKELEAVRNADRPAKP